MAKILVIDDTKQYANSIKRYLEEMAYEVLTAYSGKEGIQLAIDTQPDLILLDILMPVMDGLTVCKKLVNQDATKDIPIILISAKNDQSDIVDGLSMGAIDYIAKPLRLPVMSARIKTALRLKKTQDELKSLNRTLVNARKNAEADTMAKSQFLAHMSHEIRTPLNSLLGVTSLLINTNLDQEQKEYVNILQTSGDALITIINDILDLSKIEAGKLDIEFQEFNIRKCFDKCLDVFLEKSRNADIKLYGWIHSNIPTYLIGDEGRTRQILLNLLSNAFKFTQHGYINIRIEIADHTSNDSTNNRIWIHCKVEDTGIGIDEDKLSALFHDFSQADISTQRKYGGTGLGLAICKRLVEIMGGEIGVHSKMGQGSCFWFKLPLTIPEQTSSIIDWPGLESRRILVFSMDKHIQTTITHQLKSFQCEVFCFSNLSEALCLLQENTPQTQIELIVADLTQSPETGLKLQNIQKPPSELSVPVIYIIDYNQQEQYKTYKSYITNPVKHQQLYQAVQSLLFNYNPSQSQHIIKRQKLNELNQHNQKTILVAEDNKVNQTVITKILNGKLGFIVEIANNGLEAVEMHKNKHYDLIFMDCHMPKMDGLDATKIIRQQENVSEHIPIIALTANALRGEKERCLSTGMDDYLPKPITINTLSNCLLQWFEYKTQ